MWIQCTIVGLGLLSATAQADALLNRMRFGRELERGLCLSSENAHSVRGIRRAEGDRLISRNDVTEISEDSAYVRIYWLRPL